MRREFFDGVGVYAAAVSLLLGLGVGRPAVGDDIFRLTEVKLTRTYYTRDNDPRDTTLKPGVEILQKNPGEVESRANRYWYDHRMQYSVDAPNEVRDGESPTLRISVKTSIDLKEGTTSNDFYLSSRFVYQSDPPEKTIMRPLEAKNYQLALENALPLTVSASRSAIFGPIGGDPDTRGFMLSVDSGVTDWISRSEMTWTYRRDKTPAPTNSVAGTTSTSGTTLAPSTHPPASTGSMPPGDPKRPPTVPENLAPGSHPPPAGQEPAPVDGMVLIAPDLVVAKGSQVLVPVRLLRGRDVMNMDFELTYQPEIAEAHADPQRGSLITEISQNNLVRPGQFKFNFAQLSPINGDGSVAGFRFTAIGPARSRTPLTLQVHTVNGSQGNRLPIRVVSGSITIYDPNDPQDPTNPNGTHPPGGPPGAGGDPGGPGGTGGSVTTAAWQPTCTGSGRQSVADAQCCLKMWVGLTPRGLFMDIDKNGEVDSRDAVVVLQNVAQGLSQ